jgi:HEAT repeat protein
MFSIFEKLWSLGPAAFVMKAILAAAAGNALLLAFILLRRTYRKRFFDRRDARVVEFRKHWDELVSGEIPFEKWRTKPFDRRIVETIVLDAFEAAGPEEAARLLKFLRTSGLIERLIFDARHHRGWRRRRALVALGRTRAPEGIPAMGEGLRDKDTDTRLAALRGLGRMACPEAAAEILTWLGEKGLNVPTLPLQTALVQASTECPQLLLPYLKHAEGPVREVLARVLGEVATAAMGLDLLQFADNELDELRAAAARALSHTQGSLSLEALCELARDPVWFVRLRAIVSLGKHHQPEAIAALLLGLTDSNRLVRFRSAEGLVGQELEMVSIFRRVLELRDLYGIHAYLTAVENASLRSTLEEKVKEAQEIGEQEREQLLEVLRTWKLPKNEEAPAPSALHETARQP